MSHKTELPSGSLLNSVRAIKLPCPVCGGEAIHAIDILERTVIVPARATPEINAFLKASMEVVAGMASTQLPVPTTAPELEKRIAIEIAEMCDINPAVDSGWIPYLPAAKRLIALCAQPSREVVAWISPSDLQKLQKCPGSLSVGLSKGQINSYEIALCRCDAPTDKDYTDTIQAIMDATGYTEAYAMQWPNEKASVTFLRYLTERGFRGDAPAPSNPNVDLAGGTNQPESRVSASDLKAVLTKHFPPEHQYRVAEAADEVLTLINKDMT